jgi:DNA polymerase III sliding clamp (beta) subunit (PCNA family)
MYHLYNEAYEAYETKLAMQATSKQWYTLTLSHTYGVYRMQVPCIDQFTALYLKEFGIQSDNQMPPHINIIDLSMQAINTIKKLKVFQSKDERKPAMCGILIEQVSNAECNLTSTDAHRMGFTPKPITMLNDLSEGQQIVIPSDMVKAIATLKKSTSIFIHADNKASINGQMFDLITERYPNYKSVIPDYNTSVFFNRESLINAIKQVLPSANKTTHQVIFNINGNTKVTAEEIDFGYSGEAMALSQSTIDMLISFNGKMLLDALNVSKAPEVLMYTEGKSSKACIFSDDNADDIRVLQMPVCIE